MRLPESAGARWTKLRPILHEELNRLPHFDNAPTDELQHTIRAAFDRASPAADDRSASA